MLRKWVKIDPRHGKSYLKKNENWKNFDKKCKKLIKNLKKGCKLDKS